MWLDFHGAIVPPSDCLLSDLLRPVGSNMEGSGVRFDLILIAQYITKLLYIVAIKLMGV